MKKTKFALLAILIVLTSTIFSQTGPAAPSSGIWALIDSVYQVGAATQGTTSAKITLKNTTTSRYTGVQFKVLYDANAFRNASVSLMIPATNLDFQSRVDSINGNITITTVYTGTSSIYSLPNGETFSITLVHRPAAVFNNLSLIDSLKFVGASAFPKYASSQSGLDTTLSLYSYGGVFKRPQFKFRGKFQTVYNQGAKNLYLALEKKPKTTGTWTLQTSITTNTFGIFQINQQLDTTYWSTRLVVRGDTMGVGNVISTSDAQLINQWVLGNAAPSGFDFYTGDVNGSNQITISDAYGVFGRIAGRFSSWPNNTKNVKFFTASEYTTIISTPTVNYTGTIPGVTNFTYNILAGQPDSVYYYAAVPGDANGTGYHMARLTPVEVLIAPTPGIESQIYNVIDMSVHYDFPTYQIEVGLPRLSVQEGNLVEIPVKILTNGIDLSSLQFGLMYNDTLLEFKGVKSTAASEKWVTFVNADSNVVEWGGYDVSNNQHALKDGNEIITMQFIALKPQNEWGVSPLWTTRKFAGTTSYKDLEITPANGVLQVMKASRAVITLDENTLEVYPNPTDGPISIEFKVNQDTKADLNINDINGKTYINVLSEQLPAGQFRYSADLGMLTPGIYIAVLTIENGKIITKKIIKQN
jgi:hypothetical protein